MQAGMSFGVDADGNVFGARLMGAPNQCLTLRLTDTVPIGVAEPEAWCTQPWPHDGDHVFAGGPGGTELRHDTPRIVRYESPELHGLALQEFTKGDEHQESWGRWLSAYTDSLKLGSIIILPL